MIGSSSRDTERNSPSTSGGMVALVLTALKLKERYDLYRQVPSEENRLRAPGPIALQSHDDGSTSHPLDGFALDTEIPILVRPRRRRAINSCVCFGIPYGRIWKTFGIVCLLTFAWQSMRLIFWAVKPMETGLENMPEFGTSLGCDSAPYILNPEHIIHSIPFDASAARHAMELHGGAVGTLIIADGASNVTDIQLELTVRTNDKLLLESVEFKYPTRDEVDEGLADSRTRLSTPAPGKTFCMRYDIVIRVPAGLKSLEIRAHSVTQIQLAPEANINLDHLSILMSAASNNQMLLPKSSVRAKELELKISNGWLVGEVAVVEKSSIRTMGGDAVSNLRVLPIADVSDDMSSVTLFEAKTGAGRSDFVYLSDVSDHRAIQSTHRSGKGDLYLHFEEAEFSGKIELQSKSWSINGLPPQRSSTNSDGTVVTWTGDSNGKDMLEAHSTGGWIGVYF